MKKKSFAAIHAFSPALSMADCGGSGSSAERETRAKAAAGSRSAAERSA